MPARKVSVKDAVRPLYLGIDLGGTNIKAGVVDDNGQVLASHSTPTEADKGPEHGMQQMCLAAKRAIEKAGVALTDLAALGVGSPGSMDLEKQILVNPHNLPGWVNLPLAKIVGERLGLPAVLQNDANAAAFGEYWVGAGRGTKSLVQFTLGTGIGCGIILDGRILEGRHSHGGECGHIRIDPSPNARLLETGLRGTLEAYASAKGVAARTKEALQGGSVASILRKQIAEGTELTSEMVFKAADGGDEFAVKIVDETAYYLAIGATTLMHTIDPDVVVFSGGMIEAGPPFLEKIRAYVRENALPVPAQHTRICFAECGGDAGLIGAAGCARETYATSASSHISTTGKAL